MSSGAMMSALLLAAFGFSTTAQVQAGTPYDCNVDGPLFHDPDLTACPFSAVEGGTVHGGPGTSGGCDPPPPLYQSPFETTYFAADVVAFRRDSHASLSF